MTTNGPGRRRPPRPAAVRSALALTTALALMAGCATVAKTSIDAWRSVNARITHPLRYRTAGADPALRVNLDRGEEELAAGNHRAALLALNRALWDLEHIQKRSLRLSELATVHDGLASVYTGIGYDERAAEERELIAALLEAKTRAPAVGAVPKLVRAKEAYVGARFRDARKGLRQALLDLEDIADTETRMAYMAQARCYLAYVYFATGERDHVREELRRLSALDPGLVACGRDAPPGVRAVIGELQRSPKDL